MYTSCSILINGVYVCCSPLDFKIMFILVGYSTSATIYVFFQWFQIISNQSCYQILLYSQFSKLLPIVMN